MVVVDLWYLISVIGQSFSIVLDIGQTTLDTYMHTLQLFGELLIVSVNRL